MRVTELFPTSHLTPHTSHLAPRTSHLTPHTSHLTPHTSHLTPHTSHHTPHPQVLSERNREIKALEKEKHSLAKRISSADALASPRPLTASSSSHPSTPARATPRSASDHALKCQLQMGVSPSASGTPAAAADKLMQLCASPQPNASGDV